MRKEWDRKMVRVCRLVYLGLVRDGNTLKVIGNTGGIIGIRPYNFGSWGRLSPLLLGPKGQQDWQLGRKTECKEGES